MVTKEALKVAVLPEDSSSDDFLCYIDPQEADLCTAIQRQIQTQCQPYQGNNGYDDFWTVAPGYSVLSKERFDLISSQVKLFTKIYDGLNQQLGSPLPGVPLNSSMPTYFRFDAMSLVFPENGVINAEVGMVPVGEGEVSAMRNVYQQLIGGDSKKVFPGSTESMSRLLQTSFRSEAIRIIIPPRRIGYLDDYRYVTDFANKQGLDILLEDAKDLKIENGRLVGKSGRVDVIYRGFQLSDLEDASQFPGAEIILQALGSERAIAFPQISFWDRKDIVARIFRRDFIKKSGLSDESLDIFPWTAVCDGREEPFFENSYQNWEFFMNPQFKFKGAKKTGYILKPIEGRESKGLVFNRNVSNGQWRNFFEDALNKSQMSNPNYLLQKDVDDQLEKFKARFYNRETGEMNLAGGFRDRMCVNVFISGDNGFGREVIIGDIDHTLRRGSRLIHTASDAVHVPVLVQ